MDFITSKFSTNDAQASPGVHPPATGAAPDMQTLNESIQDIGRELSQQGAEEDAMVPGPEASEEDGDPVPESEAKRARSFITAEALMETFPWLEQDQRMLFVLGAVEPLDQDRMQAIYELLAAGQLLAAGAHQQATTSARNSEMVAADLRGSTQAAESRLSTAVEEIKAVCRGVLEVFRYEAPNGKIGKISDASKTKLKSSEVTMSKLRQALGGSPTHESVLALIKSGLKQ